MDNIISLCILGVIVLVGLYILMMIMRNMGGGGRYDQYGSETPRYDDPNVQSRGFFGGRRGGGTRGSESPRYDDPNVRSRGFFGGRRSSGSSQSSAPKSSGGSRSYDSPKVKSRGGFGGKKD